MYELKLTKAELEILIKALDEKAKSLREQDNYYKNDKAQATYFDTDVLLEKLKLKLKNK